MGETMQTNLKKIREDRGMSQAELAKLMGTTNQTISRWERGERGITLETLDKLSSALRTTIAQILGLTGSALSTNKVCEIRFIDKGEKFMIDDQVFTNRSTNTDDLRALSVEDDRMAPTFCKGDIVVVDTLSKNIRVDGIFAIAVKDQGVFITRSNWNYLKEVLTLKNDNPLNDDVGEVNADDLEVVGQIIWGGKQF
tara:strand:+ start:355 stop:945 length:591 start_codon:yes stop_codon:yes gene_type:complete